MLVLLFYIFFDFKKEKYKNIKMFYIINEVLFIKQNIIYITVIILLLVALFIPNNLVAKIVNDCTSGCLTENNICLPVGTRTSSKYCHTNNNLESLELEDESCQDNYECKTNICVEGQCKSYLSLKQSYCTIREELGYESYGECYEN